MRDPVLSSPSYQLPSPRGYPAHGPPDGGIPISESLTGVPDMHVHTPYTYITEHHILDVKFLDAEPYWMILG